MASTYYVNSGTGGSDAADGSASTPWKTITFALTQVAAGDTLNLTGIFREFLLTVPVADLTIQKDPEASGRPLITGHSTPPSTNGTRLWNDSADYTWAGATWTADGTAFYAVANALPADIVGATINWETSIDAYGRRYGHLTLATDLADCKATENSYWIDTGTSRLYVNPAGSPANMTGLTVRLIRGGSGLTAVAKHGLRLSNLDFGPHSDPDANTTAYNVVLDACHDVTIDGCRFFDGGYHNMGWTGSGSVLRCTISNSHAYGCRNTGATNWVVHSIDGTIEDVEYINCSAHCYGRLYPDGTEIAADAAGTPKGFYSHGSGDPETIVDLEYINCDVYAYGSSVGVIAFAASDTVPATDWTRFDTYPVRLTDCRALDVGCIVTSGGSIAIRRGQFNAEDFANGHGDNTGTTAMWNGGTAACMYVEAAQIVVNTGVAASGSRNLINWRGSLCMLNCLCVDYSTLNTISREDFFIAKTTGATRIKVLGNIFARLNKSTFVAASTGTFCNFSPVVAGPNWDSNLTDVDIKGNCYIGITVPGYPATAAFDTMTEWFSPANEYNMAETDGTGLSDQYPTANNTALRFFPIETVFCTPSQGWLANVTKYPRTSYEPQGGINGQRYDGSYGPFQEGNKFTGYKVGFGARRDRARSRCRAT